MRATKFESIATSEPDKAFQAALGVIQNDKKFDLLAVHNEGRNIFAFERSKMSNPKFFIVVINDAGTDLNIAVGTDPRTPKALLDGRANGKSVQKFAEAVRGAIDGSAPAPVTPVENHYVQKDKKVPWIDPTVEPDIELGFNWFGFRSGA